MFRVREVLDQIDKPNGLYPNYLNPRSGVWGSRKFIFTIYWEPGIDLTVFKKLFQGFLSVCTQIWPVIWPCYYRLLYNMYYNECTLSQVSLQWTTLGPAPFVHLRKIVLGTRKNRVDRGDTHCVLLTRR